ncbi:hypothetical protein DL96DRAFT_1581241 [Flagelloscypha sp. PMI_526]|nr:hypothetical protein DL96DRAFT_1581241 [Flagelloscypha sp. PMI_526]
MFAHVMPYVKSLELVEVGLVPVLDVLDKAPQLSNLFLSSELALLFGDSTDNHLAITTDLDITFGAFSFEDLDPDNSQDRFLERAGKYIPYLNLQAPYGRFFPPDLIFLDPLDLLRAHLRQLTLGIDMYESIVMLKNGADPTSFETFTSLKSLAFSLKCPAESSDWLIWFDWIAISFSHTPKSFNTLQFSITTNKNTAGWDDKAIPGKDFQFNDIAPSSTFSIDIVVPSSDGTESNERLFRFIRSWLGPWEEVGKLKFWVDLSR